MYTRSYTKNSNPNYFIENPLDGNCGSFALNVEEWYISDLDIDNTITASEMLDEGRDIDDVFDYLTFMNVKQILKDFEGEVRILFNKRNVHEDEELIAYRIGIFTDEETEEIETDFHFKVRRNGKWMEKPGSTEVRECDLKEDEEWVNSSNTIYNGPVIFLAKKI